MPESRNQELFEKLRKAHPEFIYREFSVDYTGDRIILGFSFSIGDDYDFHPKAIINTGSLAGNLKSGIDALRPLIDNLAFQIGLVEMISYWKATCSPIVRILPSSLSTEQETWWRKLFYHGLGEFRYLNSILVEQDNFVEFRSEGTTRFSALPVRMDDSFLVPIGGGKDSAVTLSLLTKNGNTIMPLIMNPRGATIDSIRAAGFEMDQVLTIERSIDPVLLSLNDKGFLNGHTPFSAMLAFYTLLCSAVTGYRNIVLSNESSANESTIPGTSINHQYSKSVEFEGDLRQYYAAYLSESFNYFSLLRPLSELQIARIFSGLTDYHDVFRSCNAGSKDNVWCGKCPKCLFTHIMLSAFTGIAEADRIIGRSMLDDTNLVNTFDELAGYTDVKPFECVGTTLEVKQALGMIADRNKGTAVPFLIERFLSKTTGPIQKPDFLTMEENHFVSRHLIDLLKDALK